MSTLVIIFVNGIVGYRSWLYVNKAAKTIRHINEGDRSGTLDDGRHFKVVDISRTDWKRSLLGLRVDEIFEYQCILDETDKQWIRFNV